MTAREQVFFIRRGVDGDLPSTFSIREDEVLPYDAIAAHYSILPGTVTVLGLDRLLTLRELKRITGRDGSPALPLPVSGHLGPLQQGFRANFRYFNGHPPTAVEVLELLFLSSTTAVYSCKACSGNNSDEKLALKLLLKEPRLICSAEVEALEDIGKLRSENGLICPSLPEFIGSGWFLASGESKGSFGDAIGRLMKPPGICVEGKLFDKQEICKAAFDLLLALYHLYLLERRHRAVRTEHIIYVQQEGCVQFLLLDFKMALEENYEREGGEVPDCIDLTRSLAEMAGSDGRVAAASVLEQVHPALGGFAEYALSLKSAREFPDYKHWLHQLAAACGLSSDSLVHMMKKELQY